MASSGGDLGLFGPGSVSWRVHSEPILLLAGLRALFLQALHPRAIAGVVQNSGYKADPWGRLMRTSEYVATTIYGTTDQARAAGRRVRAIHARMRAMDPRTGAEFRVDEPELLRWVHVTEVESFLTTAVRAGLRLTPAEADAYYAEQRAVGALVGLSPAEIPGSAAEVAAYYREIRPALAMTRDAADTLLFLAAPPVPRQLRDGPLRRAPVLLARALEVSGRAAYLAVSTTAFSLLPAWARRTYGALGLPTTDLSASLSARSLRMMLGLFPHRVYEGPLYQAAMARARAHEQGRLPEPAP